MGRARRVGREIRDLWAFMCVRKRWWLLPPMLLLVVMGALITVGEGSAALPFIYTLF